MGDRVFLVLITRASLRDVALADALAHPRLPAAVAGRYEPREVADRVSSKAYWELLTRHATLNNVPIAMQIAIVREESAFDPPDESYA